MDAAARGQKALDQSDYKGAIEQYSLALKEYPTSPLYLTKRSTAYLRNKQFHDSLADAEQAVLSARARGKRELIIEAQLRRGVALFNLGQLANAAFVLNIVKTMDVKNRQCDIWINKVSKELEGLPNDDEKRQVTIAETPVLTQPASPTAMTTSTGVPSARTPAANIRYEWYQNGESIYFTLLAKGVPKDKAQIDITPNSLSISFPLQDESSYDLTIEPFCAEIIPEKSTPRVTPHKIEVTLVKARPGHKWTTLESIEGPKPQAGNPGTLLHSSKDTKTDPVRFAELKSDRPSYPTSSKSGPKDWDKITSGNDDDEVEGDEANHFFKKLFKGATPEVQRAMMKSYTESNGTALSTNWEEVSKGPVDTHPPDGMEAKKWSS